MKRQLLRLAPVPIVLAALLLLPTVAGAHSLIEGLTGTNFAFTVKEGYVTSGDGISLYFWGLSPDPAAGPQYPAPTLILNQGDTITVTLRNALPVAAGRVSLVFPGMEVSATGGVPGLLTREAAQADDPGTAGVDESAVVYTFTASRPGTFLYNAGTRPELQVEMGVLGAIVVRPIGFNPQAGTAYGDARSAFDHEYLFVLSEMDPRIHQALEFGIPAGLAAIEASNWLSDYFSGYWFLNGRTAPDSMLAPHVPWMPTQPYGSMVRMRPGESVLMRVVSAGRDLHPFHHHGNHARVIAKDARLLESAPGQGVANVGPDLGYEVFTIQAIPGETVDAIFSWTGKGMGWDLYGTGEKYEHTCNGISVNDPGATQPGVTDPVTKEDCGDHGKLFPVVLPEPLDLTFGGFYSGSPYLGTLGSLPPGQGGLNPNAGFTFMWHSHTEKELTNFDIFPGGMMTMLIVEPPGTPIP